MALPNTENTPRVPRLRLRWAAVGGRVTLESSAAFHPGTGGARLARAAFCGPSEAFRSGAPEPIGPCRPVGRRG